MGNRAKSALPVRAALRAGIVSGDRVVLAVSGGRDSMVLLDAAVRWRQAEVVAVATFDHGTGAAARAAVDLVRFSAAALGVPVVVGVGRRLGRTEAAWREARWSFLDRVALEHGARVATGHTRDDQLETVFMRLLRGSGPRGIAGLYAASDIARPLLALTRAEVAAFAEAYRVPFVEDPSNRSRRMLRNRVRLDHLPAFERLHPGFGAELIALARRSALWREDVEALVARCRPRVEGDEVFVDAEALRAFSEEALGHLWPAIAARAGVVLDRRGTERVAAFTLEGAVGGWIPLAGGHVVRRYAATFSLRAGPPAHSALRHEG
jgi:tRNA(Ile)-lysidine synthase